MADLKCPACDHRGPIRGTQEFFSIRGKHPRSRLPMLVCGGCGTWMTVRARGWFLPSLGWVARPVPWGEREVLAAEWERQFPTPDPTKRAECPTCGKRFPTERARDEHAAAKHS